MFRRFARSQDGSALVFVTVTLPALIGFALLAVDASRVYNLHYDLQKGADAFSLAAAAELDGTGDACIRADRAIDNLLSNTHNLSDLGLHTLARGDVAVRYLNNLPANDDTPIPAGFVVDCETEATDARFAEVTINPTQITSIFPASFLGGANTQNYSASAVAGYGSVVCDFTPIYICNPYETTPGVSEPSLETVVNTRSLRRRLIQLRKQGGGEAQNFPGNYGFLQPPDGRGADALRESIARVHPNACFSANGVELHTGYIASVRQAINVRFDIYEGSFNSAKNNPTYRPAKTVRKGYKDGNGANGACNPEPETVENGFMGLPRDGCFYSGSCTTLGGDAGGRLGDGDWDLTTYWTTNHPASSFPAGSNWADTAASRPTRYEVYLAEKADLSLNSEASVGGEVGGPQCYGGGTLNDTPDRRLIYGAVLNCKELENLYGPINGSSAPPLPVETFASFFLTEPLPTGPDDDIFVEMVDINSAQGQGSLLNFARDDVQLFR